MKLFITARAGSHIPSVTQIDDSHFVVAVRERPENGEANTAIAAALAAYLQIPRSRISLKSGSKGKKKVFEVEG